MVTEKQTTTEPLQRLRRNDHSPATDNRMQQVTVSRHDSTNILASIYSTASTIDRGRNRSRASVNV